MISWAPQPFANPQAIKVIRRCQFVSSYGDDRFPEQIFGHQPMIIMGIIATARQKLSKPELLRCRIFTIQRPADIQS